MKMSVFGIGYYVRAGVSPSRISRRAFIRGRAVLTVAFFAVLSAPMFLALAAGDSEGDLRRSTGARL